MRIETNSYINKFNFSQMIVDKLNSQITEQATKILNLEADLKTIKMDYKIIQGSSEYKDTYIEYIEKVQVEFLMKLKKLQKNHPSLTYFNRDPI